jgi:asparagine synthase (glutamine-hydrolysing)
MAHSIENRVPFLDNDMINTALAFNDEDLIQFKNERMEGKFPLKQICSQIFGDEFTYRDKMGFGIPLRTFFNSIEFQEKWSDVLLPSIKNRGIFNYKPLVKWMANPQKLNTAQIDAIWLMVGFEIWAKQYLD